jgi:hypothetical protein
MLAISARCTHGCTRGHNLGLSSRRRISGTPRWGVASPRRDRRCSLLVIRDCGSRMTHASSPPHVESASFPCLAAFTMRAWTFRRDGFARTCAATPQLGGHRSRAAGSFIGQLRPATPPSLAAMWNGEDGWIPAVATVGPPAAALAQFRLFRPSHPALAQHRDGPPRYLPWQRQDSQEVGFCARDRADIDLWNRVSVPHLPPCGWGDGGKRSNQGGTDVGKTFRRPHACLHLSQCVHDYRSRRCCGGSGEKGR